MEISEVNPDGNVYQLKDSTARTEIAQIKAQNAYTTEEQDTGKKWIDGKTIYRAVISMATVPSSLSLANYGITPSEVISLTGMGYNATSTTDKIVANTWFSNFFWSVYYKKSENSIRSSATNTVINGFFIIEYTKA